MSPSADLYSWTKPELHKACSTAYNAYSTAKTAQAKAYFAAHPELKDPHHEYKAKDAAAALPSGWEHLADLIPPKLRHRHHLSGNSSQWLALGLLGVSRELDPSHHWLWEAFSPVQPATSSPPAGQPEFELPPAVLNEDPGRTTSIDYLVSDAGMTMCIECKWIEEGMGGCSCTGVGGDPSVGHCRDAVLNHRPAYWSTSTDVFRLPDRRAGKPCPLSPVYQAVRNVAAALALRPEGGQGVFGLIYDDQNPYFAGCGVWPGWPRALSRALDDAHPDLRFRAVSWQELMPLLKLDDITRAWAAEKHGLT